MMGVQESANRVAHEKRTLKERLEELESSQNNLQAENEALKQAQVQQNSDSSHLRELQDKVSKLELSIASLKDENEDLKRRKKGNPMAAAMQKQMIAALREENNMLRD